MDQKAMMDALVQVKRMGNLLNEVQDLSLQLAEAMGGGAALSARVRPPPTGGGENLGRAGGLQPPAAGADPEFG